MAAYIDLNPVRAGTVTNPEDYRWCCALRPAMALLLAVTRRLEPG